MKRTIICNGSSSINKIAWDDSAAELTVHFKPGKDTSKVVSYVYSNIGIDEFVVLATSESIGSTFHHLVKKNPELYTFVKIVKQLPDRDAANGQFKANS